MDHSAVRQSDSETATCVNIGEKMGVRLVKDSICSSTVVNRYERSVARMNIIVGRNRRFVAYN